MSEMEKGSSSEAIAKTMDKKGSAETMPGAKGASMDKSADVGKKNAAQYAKEGPESHS